MSNQAADKERYISEVGLLHSDEIIQFKSNAWSSRSAAEKYSEDVEHEFFNGVVADLFLRHIKPTDKVLDVGAGTGRLTLKVAELGCSVVAVDISQPMLDVLEAAKGDKKITIVATSCDKLPFFNGSFDAIVQMDFLAHFPNWQELLLEQARTCKSGGVIVFSFINGDNLKHFHTDPIEGVRFLTNGDFFASCTEEELRLFCDANGLEIISRTPYSFFTTLIGAEDFATREEWAMLWALIKKTRNRRKLEALIRFEREIVTDLPADMCAYMVVALRKK